MEGPPLSAPVKHEPDRVVDSPKDKPDLASKREQIVIRTKQKTGDAPKPAKPEGSQMNLASRDGSKQGWKREG